MRSSRPGPCSKLREIGGPSGAAKLGKLGECLILDDESTSVPNVVRLSLAVEFEGARPESRRTSLCSLARAVWGDRRWLFFGRLRPVKLCCEGLEGGVATVIGIGGSAAVVSSYGMPFRLSWLGGLREGGAGFMAAH